MRKLLVAAAMLPTALMLTAAAAPTQDLLDQLTTKANEVFGEKGYSPSGWVNNGSLATGGEKTFSVTLKGAEIYSLVGMCDNGCKDLNMVVKDSKGNEIGSDLQDDDFPIVQTDKAGTFQVTVSMVKCETATCRFRLLGYNK